MTQFLPPNLLALFAAREPVVYLPPVETLSNEKKRRNYTGIAQFVHTFERTSEKQPSLIVESKEERAERKRKEKAELAAYRLEQDLALWNPKQNAKATDDPYKTLFVSRIAHDTSESKLKREFGIYGRIRCIRLIHNIEIGKPRGYAFIEYEKESDMHAAYKYADGKKIDGRRVIVDVERGRTVKGWRPRRLAGGLGSTRRGESSINNRYSGREDAHRAIGGSPSLAPPSRHHGPSLDDGFETSIRHRRDSRERRDRRDHRMSSRTGGPLDSRRRSSRSTSRDRYSRRRNQRSQISRSDRSTSRDRRRYSRRDASRSASKSSHKDHSSSTRREQRNRSRFSQDKDYASVSNHSSPNRTQNNTFSTEESLLRNHL
ncbi:hypothetical protein GJ496_003857 [Pomphorhynchus laevis]|nr:hypothetical protein GJ496_003857 [Pomphorhynchus laevis]